MISSPIFGCGSRAPEAGFERGGGAVVDGAFLDRVEGLSGDAVLGAKRGHRPSRSIRWPLGDRETDTGINGFDTAHSSKIEEKCHHQTGP